MVRRLVLSPAYVAWFEGNRPDFTRDKARAFCLEARLPYEELADVVFKVSAKLDRGIYDHRVVAVPDAVSLRSHVVRVLTEHTRRLSAHDALTEIDEGDVVSWFEAWFDDLKHEALAGFLQSPNERDRDRFVPDERIGEYVVQRLHERRSISDIARELVAAETYTNFHSARARVNGWIKEARALLTPLQS